MEEDLCRGVVYLTV